ncbi:MAG: hypothetical protein GY714_12390 [Desulfobacterales bacterium]|nr:hypothetical protein [Desulfobacterales bacterium]
MNREEAIQIIEQLFPADSHETGKDLLAQAKSEIKGWRREPTPVLIRYAQLCMERENRNY